MKLTTRIAGFEWLLIGLLVMVSAVSINLLGSQSSSAAKIIRTDYKMLRTVAQMREALWTHEVANTRVRIGEGRPQELYEARARFSRALEGARGGDLPEEENALVESLVSVTDRYFTGESVVESTLEATAALEQAARARIERDADAARTNGEAAMALIATIGAIAVLLGLVLAARASRRITQPLETLHRTVVALTDETNGHRRVPDGDYDATLRELGKAVNQLAERLEQAERAPNHQRALVDAAADRLIERLGTAMVIVDLTGCMRLSNKAARGLLDEYSPDELEIPQRVRGLLAQDQPAPSASFPLVGAAGAPVGFALRLQAPKTV